MPVPGAWNSCRTEANLVAATAITLRTVDRETHSVSRLKKRLRAGARAAFWSSVLAVKDSDGDGASNGAELGDPDGDGKPTVGAELTNPGNSKSKPTIPVEPVVPKLVIENPKFPFSLRFKTVKGQDYEVQSTADFQSWTTLAKIKGTGTEKVFADRRKALYPRQYYRVKLKE